MVYLLAIMGLRKISRYCRLKKMMLRARLMSAEGPRIFHRQTVGPAVKIITVRKEISKRARR